MKKKFMAVLMVVCLSLSLLPTATLAAADSFADVKDADWFSDAVTYVSSEGLMTGTDLGFEPYAKTSRATIWTILARMDGVDTKVNVGDWYAIARQWSINSGVSDGTDPNGQITREQLAAMLYRFAQLKGLDVSVGESTNILSYPDALSISDFAFSAMQWACGAGIITGSDAGLNPKGTAGRAEVAVMLYRLCTRTDILKKAFTVEFDYNCDGMGIYATASVTEGETVEVPIAPTRKGFTFAGWYTAPTGGVRYDFKTPVTGDLVLYAHWNAVTSGSGSTVIPHRHRFNWVLESVEPTCTEGGYTTYICRCGETYTEEFDALDHDFSMYETDWTALTSTLSCSRTNCTETNNSELPENTLYINNITDLKTFREVLKTKGEQLKDKTVVLNADIDLKNEIWEPIELNTTTGLTFDGNDHTIYNLKVVTSGKDAGFFGQAWINTIKNLTINGATVTGIGRMGVIAGQGVCSVISDCHVKNAVVTVSVVNNDDGDKAGAIIGYLSAESNASITGCTVERCTIKGYRDIGGLVGYTTGTITGNTVKNTSIINERTNNYQNYTVDAEFDVNEIVGQGTADSSNTFENVTITRNPKAIPATATNLSALLTSSATEINVVLTTDIDLSISSLGTQVSGSGQYRLGGADTTKINIDLGGHKLTLNSSYMSALGANNSNAVITVKNGTMTSTSTGTWNLYDLIFDDCSWVFEDVTFEKSVALKTNTQMKNCTISDSNDVYALWITAQGQTVTLNNLTVNCPNGRAIAIKDQYVDSPAKVTLNITGGKMTSAKKAAVLVTSTAGANINASRVNIRAVEADSKNLVWVDNGDGYKNIIDVTVTGCSVILEP